LHEKKAIRVQGVSTEGGETVVEGGGGTEGAEWSKGKKKKHCLGEEKGKSKTNKRFTY